MCRSEADHAANADVVEQEKQDHAHHSTALYDAKKPPMDADAVVDDLANDVSETANDDKQSGAMGVS